MFSIPLATLGAVVLAVVALIVLYGAVLLFKAIGSQLPDIDLLGFNPQKAFISAGNAVQKWAAGAVLGVIGAASALFDLLHKPLTLIAQAVHAVETIVYHRLQGIVLNDIPQAVDAVRSEAFDAVANAANAIDAAINHDIAAVETNLATAVWQIDQAIATDNAILWRGIAAAESAAIGYVNTVAANVYHTIGGVYDTLRYDVGAVEGWAVGTIDTLRTTIATDTRSAIDYATRIGREAVTYAEHVGRDVYDSVIGQVEKQATDAVSGLWPGMESAVRSANGTLAGLFPGLEGELRNPTVAVPTTIGGVLAGVMAGVITTTESINRCSMPNCEEKNLLAHEAKNLSGLVSAGIGLAFLVAAITEPTATARDSIDVVEAIAVPVVDAVKALV